jgi:histone acetyltransferase
VRSLLVIAVLSTHIPSLQPPIRQEKAAAVELRRGVIQITPVENDRSHRSLVILTGLKTLFQKQLPNMPREYIARLVYDANSKDLAIIKRGYKVVGGICYRPFPHRGFAEIVFFATASVDQEKVLFSISFKMDSC